MSFFLKTKESSLIFLLCSLDILFLIEKQFIVKYITGITVHRNIMAKSIVFWFILLLSKLFCLKGFFNFGF